jgi:F-type H+-transporting ATPase subunit gamma
LPDIRLIQRRIKGVQSIVKITRAMEMIATSKMRRTQERGLAGRPYSEKIRQVIADLFAMSRSEEVPILCCRPASFPG